MRDSSSSQRSSGTCLGVPQVSHEAEMLPQAWPPRPGRMAFCLLAALLESRLHLALSIKGQVGTILGSVDHIQPLSHPFHTW